MYQQAVGFNPGSLLSRLSSAKASPFAKGLAMQTASGLGMDREKQNQDLALKQMQDESQQRQQAARNAAQNATNVVQERTRASQLRGQSAVFEEDMRNDYASLQKQRRVRYQQALLDGLTRDF